MKVNLFKGRLLALRIYSIFIALASTFGLVYHSNLNAIHVYYSCFVIFILLFYCITNKYIFTKTGLQICYLFLSIILIRIGYDVFLSNTYLTTLEIILSQMFYIIAAVLWWIIIRRVIASSIVPPVN